MSWETFEISFKILYFIVVLNLRSFGRKEKKSFCGKKSLLFDSKQKNMQQKEKCAKIWNFFNFSKL